MPKKWIRKFEIGSENYFLGNHPNQRLSHLLDKNQVHFRLIQFCSGSIRSSSFIRSSNHDLGLILMSVNPSKSFTNHPLRDFEECLPKTEEGS